MSAMATEPMTAVRPEPHRRMMGAGAVPASSDPSGKAITTKP